MASDTRERIIDAAIALFSEEGTRPVTTNHIARRTGISPGNLYYHFRSKEEIVRAIYERAIVEYDAVWAEVGDVDLDPLSVLRLLDAVFSHQWKYRCIQREFPVLIRRDDVLAARYREMQDRRLSVYRFLCVHWVETGRLLPMTLEEIEDLVQATWLVGESWLGYLDAMGRGADESEARRGSRLVYSLLRPHLADEAVLEIEASNWVQ